MTIFCVFVSTAYVTTNTHTNQKAENVSNRDGIFQPELERSVLCDCDTFDIPLPDYPISWVDCIQVHACNMHLLTIVPTYDDVFLTVAREYTHISIQSINQSIKNFILIR
jgi:hypothetical protein